MKKELQEKGVTLIVLVVTTIILIIVAGISTNITIGKNGIITKAQQAKENMLLAQEEEAKGLNQLYNQLNNIEGSKGEEGDSEAIDKLLNFKKVIATAITNEGVMTQETDSAETMASNIEKILQERTKNATATAEDILKGKTAWINGDLITGNRNINSVSNFTITIRAKALLQYMNNNFIPSGGQTVITSIYRYEDGKLNFTTDSNLSNVAVDVGKNGDKLKLTLSIEDINITFD